MTENIIKGAFKEGGIIASVVQSDRSARILVKGLEPGGAGDPEFLGKLKHIAVSCAEHVKSHSEREICAVLGAHPELAETLDPTEDQINEMGLTRVAAMDGNCGIVVRACEKEPAATPLPYASLSGGGDLAVQPGLATIPPEFTRKTWRDLNDNQKKIYEVAAQLMGEKLRKLVCIDDEGLKLVCCISDFPPARGRSILVPLATLADQFAGGTALEAIGKRLHALRG